MSNYWVNLEKDKCLKFPVSSTQYVLVSCDIIACIIVDEMLLDKLNSESILTSN